MDSGRIPLPGRAGPLRLHLYSVLIISLVREPQRDLSTVGRLGPEYQKRLTMAALTDVVLL